MDATWTPIDSSRPNPDDLIIFYIPIARYVWGCGLDYDQIKGEYPAVTHWKVATVAPDTK